MSYFLFTSNPDDVDSFDETLLKKQIAVQDSISSYWKQESQSWQAKAIILEHKNDSLEKLKPLIKNYYNEKYNFNASANIDQLDSIIRSGWRTR